MKYLLMATFSLMILGTAKEASALGPAGGLLKSVGVISPKGEVMLYYREGNDIVIKNCAPLTVLGKTPKEAKTRCKGRTSKVPVETFRRILKANIPAIQLGDVKPLTISEVESYKKSGVASAKIQAMIDEIDRINKFLKIHGETDIQARLDELLQEIGNQKAYNSKLWKINAEIDNTIKLITDEKQIRLVDANSEDCNKEAESPMLYTVLRTLNIVDSGEPFPYTALKNFDTSKIPCGQKGSVEERIKDCASQKDTKKGNFSLVARTPEGNEVWKDTKSGMIWSDVVGEKKFDDALGACKNGLPAMAGISGKWKLPSKEDYETALENGILKVTPNNLSLWSSTFAESIVSQTHIAEDSGITYHSEGGQTSWNLSTEGNNMRPVLLSKYGQVKCVTK